MRATKRAPGGRKTGIERAGQALVGPVQDAQAGMFRRQGIQQGRRAVRGAVIDGQYFKGRHRGIRRGLLPGQGTDGHAQGLFPPAVRGREAPFQTGSRTVTSGQAGMSPPEERTGSASGRCGHDAFPVMFTDAAGSAPPGTVP